MKNKLSLILLLMTGLYMNLAVAMTENPRDFIMETSNDLLNSLIGQASFIKTDQDIALLLIEEKLVPHIDFGMASRLALGKHWSNMDVGQQARFQLAFKAMLMRTYSVTLMEFIDQMVVLADDVTYLPLKPSQHHDRTVVSFRLNMTGGMPLQVSYLLKKIDTDWRLYDINIEGISMVAANYGSFNRLIHTKGIDGLIDTMEEKYLSGDDAQLSLVVSAQIVASAVMRSMREVYE